MTTTTTSTSTLSRRAALGSVGGALWALSPAVWSVADVRTHEFGTLSFVAVLASYWAALFIGPVLIVVGHTALRTGLAPAGRTAAVGTALASAGLTAVAAGNGIELASLSTGGGTSVVGYVISYLGFLVAFIGSLLIGMTVLRRRRDLSSRIAGWLLSLAIPLGIGIGMLMAAIAPDSEAGFAAAISVPTGMAWLLLGRALSTEPLANHIR